MPWALWQAYGNLHVLADQFESMAAHLRRVESLLSPHGAWDQGFQFGDWLDPTAPPDKPADAKADKGVVATAVPLPSARMIAEARDPRPRRDAAHLLSSPTELPGVHRALCQPDGMIA